MRKLILSVAVIAASGVYVAWTAAGSDAGWPGLIDRLTFRGHEAAPLDLGEKGVLPGLGPGPSAPSVAAIDILT